MKKLVVAITSFLLVGGVLLADTSPIMVSLFDPVQWPSDDCDVTGLRLSLIYGECNDFAGLDIGIANRASGEFTGLAVGGLNIANSRLYGGQIGLINWNDHKDSAWETRSIGGQIGLVNYCESFCGLQDGLVNVSSDMFTGLQSAYLNVASEVRGAQVGVYAILGVNFADTVTGCQIGLFNCVNRVDCGIQIGLLNINTGNGWFPVLPIVNGVR